MRHQNADVAVIGAGGLTGRAVVAALSACGVRVRAVLHRPPHPDDRQPGVTTSVAELNDVSSLRRALAGARAVHFIPPTYAMGEERFGTNVIAAALAEDVRRIGYHSVLHAPTPAMIHHARKARVELMLRESPLAWTILQPAMYAQTPLAFLSPDRTTLMPGFDTTRPFTPIDVRDIAEAAARVLVENGHVHATYELAGAQVLTFEEMAAIMSQATGTTIAARRTAPDAVLSLARARGFSGTALDELALMMAHYDRHGLVGNANVLRMLLKREPTGFDACMTRELAATAP